MAYTAKGRKKSFPVFDCDSHVYEPPEVWDKYIPQGQREFAKTWLYVNTDRGVRVLNGKVSFLSPRANSFTAEVWNPTLTKEDIGSISPHLDEWDEKIGRNAITRDPHARLRDMDASGVDQVMVFPSAPMVAGLPLVRNAEAARICARAYNDWVYDYCAASPKRLFPCAILPVQDVGHAKEELRRVAELGFRAAAVRPVLASGKYPTFPEYDPLWYEFEELGLALGMHTFIAPGTMTEDLAHLIARAGGGTGGGFDPDVQLYSPGQFAPNILAAMGAPQIALANLSFMYEASTWTTIVLMSGWLQKFPKLKVAVLESNATWLPLVLEKAEANLTMQRFALEAAGVKIEDPREIFYRQCYIGFESDEDPVFRMWDLYAEIALWASDMPHLDAADAWEAMDHMAKWKVPQAVQAKMLGGNACRLYGIEQRLFVTQAPEEYKPTKLPRLVA